MNHGFAVVKTPLRDNVDQTHVSLFDGSNCGLALKDNRCSRVQVPPEACLGPRQPYLFQRFHGLMRERKKA